MTNSYSNHLVNILYYLGKVVIHFVAYSITYLILNAKKFWYVWFFYILIEFAKLYLNVQGVING